MREILFRGKRVDNGEWVEGVPVPIAINSYLTNRIELVRSHSYDELDGFRLLSEDEEVVPETLGEYTGLQDNNGSKIFEGDIVECCEAWSEIFDEDCTIRVVKYGMDNYGGNQFVYGWYFEQIGINYDDDCGDNPGIYDEICQKRLSNCLVIGNIHDNPELLEVK